jgi:protein-arginine kinase activator protein McsA
MEFAVHKHVISDEEVRKICNECRDKLRQTCEDCGEKPSLHDFVGSDDKEWRLCTECRDEAQQACDEEERRRYEEEEDEYYRDDLGQCESCQKEKAVIVFMHLYNGNFELCKSCFDWADHERDYGKDFKREEVLVKTMEDFLRG